MGSGDKKSPIAEVVDEFTYDSESNLIAHAVHAPNGSDYLSDNSVFDQRGKMVSAHTSGPQGSADILLAYSGLGAVTATEQQGTIGGFTSEAFTVDALGNRSERKQTSDTYDPGDQFRHRTFRYNTWNQLEGIDGEPQAPPYNNYYAETYAYDPAGNTTLFHKNTNETGGGGLITYNDSPLIRVGEGHASLASGKGGPNASGFDEAIGTRYDQVYHQESHISYYGADNKLRVFNRHVGFWMTSADSLYGDRGVFEEYRYDALGRRVLTRTRRIGGGCPGTLDCQSRATRAVWDGDRILYEIRSPGGEVETGSPPDTVPDPGIEGELTVIGYAHAIGVSGIDEPVAILASQSIFPHTGWRGMLAMGTYANGAESDCPVANPCDRIDWPGSNVTIDRRGFGRDEPTAWYGTLASSQGEGSGLQYMRNRYYDPTRGQFSQADPIGLAAGMNLYGFAEGDPINYSDPFGLCPIPANDCPPGYFTARGLVIGAATGAIVAAACTISSEGICSLVASQIVGGLTALGASIGAAADASNGTVSLLQSRKNQDEVAGGHRKDPRESTRGRHEKGEARRRRDQGREKGDAGRAPNPNKRKQPPANTPPDEI